MKKSDQIIKVIEQQISRKSADTFINHLSTCFGLGNDDYLGNVQNHSFIIWSKNSWVGVLYPVIQGEIIDVDGNSKVKLSSKMNSVGRALCLLLFVGIFYGASEGMVSKENNSWIFQWEYALLGILATCPMLLAIRLVYKFEKRSEIIKIRELLKIGFDENS